MAIKQMFRENSEESYFTWRTGRLFGVYLSCFLALDQHGELHSSDMGELEKVTLALNSRYLPEKVRFYNSLGDVAHKKLYQDKFLNLD